MWKVLACGLFVALVAMSVLALGVATEDLAEAQQAPADEGPWKVVKGVPVEQWAAHMNALQKHGWEFHSAADKVLIFRKK